MDKLNNKTIINNIFDFIGKKTCPNNEIPETFYLNTSATIRNKINKCARYFKCKDENIYLYT